jgi:glycosyltransferase involved in cell wall biosynthesis
MLDRITPVLLTYNEIENIARTLSHLAWARDVVIVDSGSTDGTLEILARTPRVRVFNRRFDSHANQWRFAMDNTEITTEWVLRLDADYQLSDALITEIARLVPDPLVVAYNVDFTYAIFSERLNASLYPPKPILLRRGCFSIYDKGHTEAWEINGGVSRLEGRIIHDDWKSTKQWVEGQARYMQLEADSMLSWKTGLIRWLRLHPPLMPIATFMYCLFGKGLLLNGRAGIFYTLQRTVAESVLSLLVLERKLRLQSGIESRRLKG